MVEGLPEVDSAGIAVRVEVAVPAAALRYFAPTGEFGAALAAHGAQLPQNGRATATGGLLLAWRSPTETVCLAANEAQLAALRRATEGASDGCLVDLSGALSVVHLAGTRIGELLCRLGGTASLPGPGESRRTRMAEVPVLSVCVRSGELRLIIDRSHAEHLLGWIRETLLDLT